MTCCLAGEISQRTLEQTMTSNPAQGQLDRRNFLGFIAGSPLLATPAITSTIATVLAGISDKALAQSYDALFDTPSNIGSDGIIASPAVALDVFDFESAAKKALAREPAHFGYLASGVDDDSTLRANREAYSDYTIRAPRLIDARKLDTKVRIFGETWSSPIFLCSVSSVAAFNRTERELGVARAAGKTGQQMILSTAGNSSIDECGKEHGSPIWFQLYPTDDWAVTQALVTRAEAAGAPAILLTVDRQGGRNTETLFRMRFQDNRQCTNCHAPGSFANQVKRDPIFSGLDLSHVTDLYGTGMTWDFVDRLRNIVKGKLVLKGIMTPEDASEAVRHGVDGILVSNHGGRAEASGQSTLGMLPGIVQAVQGRMLVLFDSGVRRGTDVFKALALGANGVGIGRPYCWGLAAFGQSGVERVLELVQTEFETIMRQAGTLNIAAIDSKLIAPAIRPVRSLQSEVPGRKYDLAD
jgi:isopentenyl diphosphate isomerase/L-lactate dehydrogenase-like FMN-dependent dehydrogenase